LEGVKSSVKEPRNANLRINSATQFTIIAIKIKCNQNAKIKKLNLKPYWGRILTYSIRDIKSKSRNRNEGLVEEDPVNKTHKMIIFSETIDEEIVDGRFVGFEQ
jgi:hypothetical protein